VRAAAEKIGGGQLEQGLAQGFWTGIREQTDPFFAWDAPLWRLSLPSNAPQIELPGAQLIEWGGALRWLKTNADSGTVRGATARAGGHATLFRAGEKAEGAFTALPPVLVQLHRGLKAVFDPAGILNPGRMSAEF
jgi:glycolate oxidase FAD binding subunit